MTAVPSPNNGVLVSGAAVITFAARYSAVEVLNEGSNTVYVRTDGTLPASPWGQAYAVPAGQRALVPNSAQFWWQGFGAADGTQVNPGTTIKLVSTSGADTAAYQVTGV
jgi:hypothetical protein